MNKINKILIYTRPWYAQFHLRLADRLQRDFPDASLQFVSFYWNACRQVREAGYEIIYLPDLLDRVKGNELSEDHVIRMDREVQESCGANINLMLQSERFLPQSREEAEIFGYNHLVVLDELVVEGTLSINFMFDHYVYWLGGALAEARGGYHFGFVPCGMPPGRVICLRTPWQSWKVLIAKEEAEVLYETAKESLMFPVEKRIEYMKPQQDAPWSKSWRYRWQCHKDNCYDSKNGNYFAEHLSVIGKLFNKAFKNKTKNLVPNYDIQCDRDLEQIKTKFIYNPLHMEPEATILMYSPWLRNQVEVVRLVAQALPVGWKLLVKEHPKMAGVRKLAYYEALKSIPNVLIVSHTVSSEELARRSELVFVMAGTAALEAAVLGKRAICLGRPPFHGVVSWSDFASGALPLENLTERFLDEKFTFNMEEWREWVSGTFIAKAVPEKSNLDRQVDYSDKNIYAYYDFIKKALDRVSV